MITLNIAYEGLFKGLSREEKKQKIEELEEKQKQYKETAYQYKYYSSTITSCKERMDQEMMKKLETYTLAMIDADSDEKIRSYSFQKENGKNKITTIDPPLPDGTKYKIYIINGQWTPENIPELKGRKIDKTIFEIKFKEDGQTIVDNEYKSFQDGEE